MAESPATASGIPTVSESRQVVLRRVSRAVAPRDGGGEGRRGIEGAGRHLARRSIPRALGPPRTFSFDYRSRSPALTGRMWLARWMRPADCSARRLAACPESLGSPTRRMSSLPSSPRPRRSCDPPDRIGKGPLGPNRAPRSWQGAGAVPRVGSFPPKAGGESATRSPQVRGARRDEVGQRPERPSVVRTPVDGRRG